jgi:Protein of unknown function (DUF1559)
MKTTTRRPAFTLFALLALLAVLLVVLGLLLAAVQKIRSAAARMQSSNNLKQLALATANYAGTYNDAFPWGHYKNDFSAATMLLPFIEQGPLYTSINFDKSIDDKANAKARGTVVKTFLSPLDRADSPNPKYAATNYLYNDTVFILGGEVGKFAGATNYKNSFTIKGTSATIALAETLKGDGGKKAVDVHRQHVSLGKDALKGIKADAGVADWKADKNIVGDRCASWMDGRFLQGTFNGELALNDERPDVSCAGLGGVSSMRTEIDIVQAALCDGSVRSVSTSINHKTWQWALSLTDKGPAPADW